MLEVRHKDAHAADVTKALEADDDDATPARRARGDAYAHVDSPVTLRAR